MKVERLSIKGGTVAAFFALISLLSISASRAEPSGSLAKQWLGNTPRDQITYSTLQSLPAYSSDATFVVPRSVEANGGMTPIAGDHASMYPNPHLYFMTQVFDSVWNPDGPPISKNCGPASLAMAYRYFGKTPPGADANDSEQFIESARVVMTGVDNNNGLTNFRDVIRGAQAGGLQTQIVRNLSWMDAALAHGAIIVASGCPNMPGSYGQRFGYGSGLYGHFILVTAHEGDQYMISDPLNRRGPSVISREELESFLRFWPSYALKGGIAIWDN